MPLTLFKTPKIPFLKYRFVFLAITLAIILAGLVNILFFSGLKMGVDFAGGTLVRVMLKTPAAVSEVRQTLRDAGLDNSVIQETGKAGHEFQIRTTQILKGADAVQEIEAHQKLGDSVIAALRGKDGEAETARGLKDLNTIDLAGLTALLATSFSADAAQITEKMADIRKDKGILTDYAELQEAGIKPEVVTFLKDKTFLGALTVYSKETVGPQAGADLRKKAVLAAIWSLIAMLVYIAARFKIENGVSAILTLTQDVLITLAIYSFTSREINLPVIAAFLTIVGFSINDTIVIFDRLRENQKALRKESLINLMDLSINQCLGRTIITTGTVFLTLLALFLFGGSVINDFAFCMLIGSIEGVYSTISTSCPIVLWWTQIFKPQKAVARKK